MNLQDLETIEILIVGSDNPNLYLTFVEKLSIALKGTDEVHPPRLKAKVLREPQQLQEAFAEDLVPALVCFDIPSLEKTTNEAGNIEEYIRGIKKLDPTAFVLGLSHKIPQKSAAMGWIDKGLFAWIKPDFEIPELEASLKDALFKRVRMVPRRIRVFANHRVELKIASLEQAQVAEVINLGVGGMFIRALPPNVKEGDKVEFKLQSATSLGSSVTGGASESNPIDALDRDESLEANFFEGTALVVWVRNQPTTEGPEGIGIQFLTVDAKTHKHFENYISHRKTKIFVTKA